MIISYQFHIDRSSTDDQLVSSSRRVIRPFHIVLGILVATLVLSFITALFVPKFGSGPDPKISAANLYIHKLLNALDAFAADTGRYPTSAEGLNALLHDPGRRDWKGPYIESLTNDSWGNPYRYVASTSPSTTPTVSSYGPDGVLGGGDDLVYPDPEDPPRTSRKSTP